MRRRHDPFLKLLYRAGARDAVALFFPELAARIDWARLEWALTEIPFLVGRSRRAVIADRGPHPSGGRWSSSLRVRVGRTRDVDGRYLRVLLHPQIQMRTEG